MHQHLLCGGDHRTALCLQRLKDAQPLGIRLQNLRLDREDITKTALAKVHHVRLDRVERPARGQIGGVDPDMRRSASVASPKHCRYRCSVMWPL